MSELERALYKLGGELEVPEAPDLVATVRQRLEARGGPRFFDRRRVVLAIAVAALALLGATLAIPDARSALFRVLHIGGERIELVDELPDIEPIDELELTLGPRITLAEAHEGSDFELRALEADPDRVYLGELGTVWFLYGSPENVRLLVAQTPLLELDVPALLKKVARETQIEEVDVDGERGVFVQGPHFLFLVDENGLPVEASARLARNVLVWDEGGVAYRLEGDFSRDEALEIARELRVRPRG